MEVKTGASSTPAPPSGVVANIVAKAVQSQTPPAADPNGAQPTGASAGTGGANTNPAATADPANPAPGGESEWTNRFANLTRQEGQLRQSRDQLKQERDAFRKEQGDWSKVAEFKANKDFGGLLAHLGLTYGELTETILNGDQPKTPTSEEQIKQIQERLDQQEKDREANEKKAAEDQDNANIKMWKDAIGEHVEKNADAFELIRHNKAYDLIWEVTERYWDEYKEMLPIEKACQLVEDELEEQLSGALKGSKRLSGKWQERAGDQPTAQNQQRTPSSITNQQSAATSVGGQKSWDDAESRRQAIAIIENSMGKRR